MQIKEDSELSITLIASQDINLKSLGANKLLEINNNV